MSEKSYNISMTIHSIIFDSKETITGIFPQTREWIAYDCILKIQSGGKSPISISMDFVPPHPFAVNMPLTHTIKAESITSLYCKIARFLNEYGIEYKC